MTARVKNNDTLELEGVQILWPNFNGDPDNYNALGGKRYFTIRIDDPELANNMRDAGWYIKPFINRDDPDEILYWTIRINVKYHPNARKYDPIIWEVTDHRTIQLKEDTVGILDSADIEYGDVVISAFDYSGRGSNSGNGTGISAYLKEGYFKIRESRFASKYANRDDMYDEPPF